MDQVSPALQYGAEKVETQSWENSSPHSLGGNLHNTPPCPVPADSSPSSLPEPEMYSVRMAVERNPNQSRASTEEPLTPTNLQLVQAQSSICSEETPDQSTNMAQTSASAMMESTSGEEVRSKNHHSQSAPSYHLGGLGGYDYSGQMVTLAPPPLPQPSSSASAEQPQEANTADSAAIPACLQFGTILPPEKQNKKIKVTLEGDQLWQQFYQAGTEMIITKSGRRMFPGIVINVTGLEPDLKYSFSMEFNPLDNARYKYINTKWVNIGKAEAHCEELLKYNHPDSPSTGKHWMSSKVSFKKVKVTNNKGHKKGVVVALNSMHKYQPRVVVSRFYSKRNQEPIFTHELVQCTFIGVTAYQNDRVTQLKIDHNPFAKAFRETGSDSEQYAYGMMGAWQPVSPLLSPYGTATFSPEGLPMLSPSCIPPAGPSPLPQFNSAFCSWESPPYSPATGTAQLGSGASAAASAGIAAFRSPFQNPGTLPSPTVILPEHHRQVISSRLMQSPPISPLLYQPAQLEVPVSTLQASTLAQAAATQQYIQQQQQKAAAASLQEVWTSGAPANTTIAFEVSSTPVGYSHQPSAANKGPVAVLGHHPVQASSYPLPKVEQASSPDLHMDVQP